mmetsp:Transcript_13996/g.40198  ORF Transcript_13996/g.40198 Transcript_13996/m.40198 type:complete len:213 (+) Transcript_13996:474-1112(+)
MPFLHLDKLRSLVLFRRPTGRRCSVGISRPRPGPRGGPPTARPRGIRSAPRLTSRFAFTSGLFLPRPGSRPTTTCPSATSALGGRSGTPGLRFAPFALPIIAEQIILQAHRATELLLLFLLTQFFLLVAFEITDEEANISLALSLPLFRTGKEYGYRQRDGHEQNQQDGKLTNDAEGIPGNRRKLRPGTFAEALVQMGVVRIITSTGPSRCG